MDAITLLLAAARLLLTTVLLAAGAGKLLHRDAFRQTLAEFGVPPALRTLLAWLMPALELAVAVAFMLPLAVWWSAVAAAGLLATFTAVLGYQLQRGRRPSCNCFGQLSAEPISAMTLLRNGLLLMLAGSVVYAGPAYPHPQLLAYLAHAPALSACGAVIALQSWLLHQTLQQNGRLILRMDALELRLDSANVQPLHAVPHTPRGLAVGSRAPDFTLPEAGSGKLVQLRQLQSSGLPILLIFSDIACGPCTELAPQIEQWHRRLQRSVTIAIVLRVDAGQIHRPRPDGACLTLLQTNREVSTRFEAQATPCAVLISPQGTIDSSLALGAKEIYDLLQSTAPHSHDEREIAA